MRKAKKYYSKEYKVEAARLATELGSIPEAAENLGVAAGSLRRRKNSLEKDGLEAFPGKGRLLPQDEELRRLRRENKRLTQEREILKKALRIFSEGPK
jgi:transposase